RREPIVARRARRPLSVPACLTPGARLRAEPTRLRWVRGGLASSWDWRVPLGRARSPWDTSNMAERPEMMDKSELLKELRIDRGTPRRSRPRARLIGMLDAVFVLVAGGLLWFAARPMPLSVQVAVARDAEQGPGPVLNA